MSKELAKTTASRKAVSVDREDEILSAHLTGLGSLSIERVKTSDGSGMTAWISRTCATLAERDRALHAVHMAMEPADLSELLTAVEVLGAVCARRADMDARQILLWAGSLARALLEYPADCALEALREWPKTENGKWLPTEAEIRGEAGKRATFRRYMKDKLEAWTPPAPRVDDQATRVHSAPVPGSPVEALVEEVRSSRRSFHDVPADEFIFSSAKFGRGFVELFMVSKNMLLREFSDLVQKHGVEVRERIV